VLRCTADANLSVLRLEDVEGVSGLTSRAGDRGLAPGAPPKDEPPVAEQEARATRLATWAPFQPLVTLKTGIEGSILREVRQSVELMLYQGVMVALTSQQVHPVKKMRTTFLHILVCNYAVS
jgi:hypothetical protein